MNETEDERYKIVSFQLPLGLMWYIIDTHVNDLAIKMSLDKDVVDAEFERLTGKKAA